MKLTNEVQAARRRALEAARREEQEAAARARDNRVDLEKAAAAQERLEAIDADLERQIAKRTAELRARAEGRRVREQRVAGAAYAAIRDRGTAVKDVARKAGVPEKVIRDCIAAHEAMPGSRLEILPGVGHYPHAESPEAVVGILDEFLSTEPALARKSG